MSVVKVLLREVTLIGVDDSKYHACIRPDDISLFSETPYGTLIVLKNGQDYTTPTPYAEFKELMNETA